MHARDSKGRASSRRAAVIIVPPVTSFHFTTRDASRIHAAALPPSPSLPHTYARIAHSSMAATSTQRLWAAVKASDVSGVRSALLSAADWRARDADDSSRTALHKAAREGLPEVLWLLIGAGADVHALDGDGCTPLHEAARWGRTAAAKVLLTAGARARCANKWRSTPLHAAAAKDTSGDLIRVLLDAGADVHAQDENGHTPLHDAAWSKSVPAVGALLAAGADVEALTNGGYTPLHWAATKDCVDVIEVLIVSGARVGAVDLNGDTPLHVAATHNKPLAVGALAAAGARIDAVNAKGWTPLHRAAGWGFDENVAATKALLKAGASTTARTPDGKTAADLARACTRAETVRAIEAGSRDDARTDPTVSEGTLDKEAAAVPPPATSAPRVATSDPSPIHAGSSTGSEGGVPRPLAPLVAPVIPHVSCELSHKDIEFSRDEDGEQIELGRGGFGVVYEGRWCGEQVAIKKVRLPADVVVSGVFWREVQLHMQSAHKHVVRVYGAAVKAVKLKAGVLDCYLVMDRMDTDLGSALHDTSSAVTHPAYRLQPLVHPLPHRLRLLLEIARGLRFLHARGIVHADLKPANIMLDKHGVAHLADFGLAVQRMLEASRTRSSHKGERGTLAYMDPALWVSADASVKPSSDMYSWGVLAWEVLTLRKPYADASGGAAAPGMPVSFANAMVDGVKPVDVLGAVAGLPPTLRDFIVRCWCNEQAARPSAQDAIALLEPLVAL
ncbi:MAG: hypothetical protein EOO41_01520 [Methanobacteriota archaeon]|nr:MAG: hypothetical protein EOO41_01520 [Euryarchaeota archaeon]